jgi:hypothetical protein
MPPGGGFKKRNYIVSRTVRTSGRNVVSPYAETSRRKQERAVNKALRSAQFKGLRSLEDESLLELETTVRTTSNSFYVED